MDLVWLSTAAELRAKGKEDGTMGVHPVYAGPFALVHDDAVGDARQQVELVAARTFRVTLGGNEYAVQILCRLDPATALPQWAVYCTDDQVKGTQSNDGKTLAAKLRAEGKVHASVANLTEVSGWVGTVPDQASCGFHRMQARTPGRLCSHTRHALANIPAPELEEMAADLRLWLSGTALTGPVHTAPLSPEEEAFYDAAFIQHVLLAGERGSGKTTLARRAAEKFDAVYLELQMHPSMEAWELRAHDRAWDGKVFTVLGKLAEAVYWIKERNRRVVLCLDEFLNMNPMYTTVINSPLTLTEGDTYIIETGRIIDMGDGIGRVETVEVPADMLWVVATTNIGARYNLDKIAPSVRARFQVILMNTNAARTKTILESTLTKYEMPLPLAAMFEKFITQCNTSVVENTLDEEATTRLACNVVRAVHKKAWRDRQVPKSLKGWLPSIKKQLMLEAAQVVNFELGPLHVEQAALYQAMVEGSFK